MEVTIRCVLIFSMVMCLIGVAACGEEVDPVEKEYAAATNAALASTERPEADTLAASRPDEVIYETYRNEAFDYAIPYPANIFEAQADIGHNHGRSFATSDGSVSLVVYATENGSSELLKREYDLELKTPEQHATYKVLRRGWFVISGYKGDKVFYQRTRLKDGLLKTFRIEYPASEKPYFDPVTEQLSFNFRG